jgi:hypothetical protein
VRRLILMLSSRYNTIVGERGLKMSGGGKSVSLAYSSLLIIYLSVFLLSYFVWCPQKSNEVNLSPRYFVFCYLNHF